MLLAVALRVVGAGEPPESAVELVERGRATIEANDMDHVDASKAGMLSAVEFFEKALRTGYPDRAQVYKLIALSYVSAAHWAGQAERRVLLEKARHAYENALTAAPNDAGAAFGLVAAAETPEEREKALRRTLKIDPDIAEAHFVLGRILTSLRGARGDAGERKLRREEGAEHLKRAAELANGDNAPETRKAVVDDLEAAGFRSDAAEVKKRYKKDLDEAERKLRTREEG